MVTVRPRMNPPTFTQSDSSGELIVVVVDKDSVRIYTRSQGSEKDMPCYIVNGIGYLIDVEYTLVQETWRQRYNEYSIKRVDWLHTSLRKSHPTDRARKVINDVTYSVLTDILSQHPESLQEAQRIVLSNKARIIEENILLKKQELEKLNTELENLDV